MIRSHRDRPTMTRAMCPRWIARSGALLASAFVVAGAVVGCGGNGVAAPADPPPAGGTHQPAGSAEPASPRATGTPTDPASSGSPAASAPATVDPSSAPADSPDPTKSEAPRTKPKDSPKDKPKDKPKDRAKPGSIEKTVSPKKVKTADPVSLGKESADLDSDVSVEITSVRQQFVRAKLPGQMSGDSVVFDLRIDNQSDEALDLNVVVVNLTDADGAPAVPITGTKPAKPFPDLLEPGDSVEATYVFIVPKERRDPVDIDVSIDADHRVVVFHGDAS